MNVFTRIFSKMALILILSVAWAVTGCSDPVESDQDGDTGVEQDGDGTNGGDNEGDTGSDADADPPSTEHSMMDILWMIDNSGSMCRSQQVVRENIESFTTILVEEEIDFHIGITTSHMIDCEDAEPGDADYFSCSAEPVAIAGHLQSRPQPLPGFDTSCHHPLYPADHADVVAEPDAAPHAGDIMEDRYDPVIANIATAIGCTTDPGEYGHLLEYGPGMQWESTEQWEEELGCALGSGNGCSPEAPTLEEFFPDPDSYRDIPRVLRSEDYRDESGDLDVDGLSDDFACASLVGTRGAGYEQGLVAVSRAVSPELTGGPDADPSEYPNAGFLREQARTGVVFLSDENDCSHNEDFEQGTVCHVDNCTIQEALGEDGDLLQIGDLADEFTGNLAASRGIDEVAADSVVPASIHGRYGKPDPEDVPSSCPVDGWDAESTCATAEIGIAWSGHRYEEFLREFSHFYPNPDAVQPDEPLQGLICHADDVASGLSGIALTFAE